MNTIPQPNIVSAEFKADPFPFLARLRASEPVYLTILPDKTKVWLLTRYEDVTALLRDDRFTKNRRLALTPDQLRKLPWTPPMFRPLERNMLDLDPPDHTRLRSLVHKDFTPRLVEEMRGRVQTLADELLEHFCLGAPLARLEAQIAINSLLRRMPDLRLEFASESLRWRPSMILRGLDALPVKFHKLH